MTIFDLKVFGWFLVAAGLPIATCAFVIFRNSLSNWPTLALLLFSSFGAVYLLFAGMWFLYSYWSIVTVFVFVLWAIAVGVARLRKGTWNYPGLITSLFSGLLLVFAAYFLLLDVTAVRSTRVPAESVELEFPFKDGVFAISQGGSGPPQQFGSHRGPPAQVFALDITQINAAGVSRSSLSIMRHEAGVMWDKPVFSPCSGEVMWARDGVIDRFGFDRETPAGNVVVIRCKGVLVYLGHFRQGTVGVRTGDTVGTGQLLGTVGASGNTGHTHLHIHAEELPFDGEFSKNNGVAMTFDGRFLWKPGLVIPN